MDWKVDFHGFYKMLIPITCSLLYKKGMTKGGYIHDFQNYRQ